MVSTAGAGGRAASFTGARLGLALATVRFAAAFRRVDLDSFLAFGRAFAPFLFWILDDCFLRLAMVRPPWLALRKRIDGTSQKTASRESRQPTLGVINR